MPFHGGGAPQVQIKAARLLMEASDLAEPRIAGGEGNPREFDALCKALQAQRDLTPTGSELLRLAELRAEVKGLKAAAGSGNDAEPVMP